MSASPSVSAYDDPSSISASSRAIRSSGEPCTENRGAATLVTLSLFERPESSAAIRSGADAIGTGATFVVALASAVLEPVAEAVAVSVIVPAASACTPTLMCTNAPTASAVDVKQFSIVADQVQPPPTSVQ